jgi:hypothetical protein
VAQSMVQLPVWSYGRVKRYLLTTTGATNVLVVPVVGDNLLLEVSGYLRITGAATNVTASVSWTDPDGGADSMTWINAQTLGVGGYNLAPVPLLAAAGSTVTVTVQAGTANQVLVSAEIRGAE